MKRNSGFSLVELIIATTIMIVLSVVAMVNYGATNRRARDSRRVSDLQKISMALEMIRQVGNTYPTDDNALIGAGYMDVLPADPKGYKYVYTQVGDFKYTLDAFVEDSGSTMGSYATDCGGVACNYRVTNP